MIYCYGIKGLSKLTKLFQFWHFPGILKTFDKNGGMCPDLLLTDLCCLFIKGLLTLDVCIVNVRWVNESCAFNCTQLLTCRLQHLLIIWLHVKFKVSLYGYLMKNNYVSMKTTILLICDIINWYLYTQAKNKIGSAMAHIAIKYVTKRA